VPTNPDKKRAAKSDVPIAGELSELKQKVTKRFWLNLKPIMEAEGGIEPPYTALQAAA
jgi:hypothetical protein